MNFVKIVKHCRIDKPGHFKLAAHDPAETFGLSTEIEDVRAILNDGIAKLAEMQQRLFANGEWAVLLVFQGMDAAGKDSVVKHVMSGINPEGCEVHSFKAPSAEELEHDFLWRIHKAVPQYGDIGIFNRSHYEDVLIVRVHNLVPKPVWSKRYKQINEFEATLVADNVKILKFFLHISKDEQKKRFEQRIDDPDRRWKISEADFAERKFWDEYTSAYEDVLERCSTEDAPWFIVPANKKWFRNLAISHIVAETLEGMHMKFSAPSVDVKKIKL